MSAAQGGVCLLAFSRGKDSIAAWLQCRKYFTRVVPYYLADVPGLRFVEESLLYFEAFFSTPIVRLMSPYFFNMVAGNTYQPPDRWDALADVSMFRALTGSDLDEYMRERSSLPVDSLIAHGWRCSDSLARGQSMRRLGNVDSKRGWFFPVGDWTANDVEREIVKAGVKLPVDYELFGRSFESVQHRYLSPLRTAFPDDHARILKLFPLAELDEFRRTL